MKNEINYLLNYLDNTPLFILFDVILFVLTDLIKNKINTSRLLLESNLKFQTSDPRHKNNICERITKASEPGLEKFMIFLIFFDFYVLYTFSYYTV